jgi:hypothetical protein
MRNERPTLMEVIWCAVLIGRRGLIMAVLTVPAGLAIAALGLMWGTALAHQVWENVPALSYPTCLTVAVSLWCFRWGVRALVAVVPPGQRTQRMTGPEHAEGVNYTGWNRPLMVTLTGTANPYLQPDLPLRGLLMVHEMRTDDYAQRQQVTFQRLSGNGKPMNAPVHVDDAQFTYALPPARSA